MKLAIGQYDAPHQQKQPILKVDPYRSNIAVFGGPLSGKTTFVKNLLVRLHDQMDRVPEESIYIIDFGGNIGSYGKLSKVCACFDDSNEENIKRVFHTIDKRLADNAKQLNGQGYYSVVTNTPMAAPPHIFLIIENINAFLGDDRYANYQDRLIHLCRDGLSKGLTVVFTANETAGLNRLMSNFGQKIAFEMPADCYYDIFGCRVNQPMRLPGRGLANIDGEVNEFQCFLPFPAKKDDAHIAALVEATSKYPNPYAMVAFGSELTRENYNDYKSERAPALKDDLNIVVGLDYYEHNPVTVDLDIATHRSIAIYGKREFGKTNLLKLLLEGVFKRRPDARFIYFDDGRKQLEPFSGGRWHISDNQRYFTDLTEMREYLEDEGYIRKKVAQQPLTEIRKTPFTVFVMQSRMLYRHEREKSGNPLMAKHFPDMISDAIGRDFLFIFSDVPGITDTDIRPVFNDSVGVAFLLDSIGDFLQAKGDKTAFGSMDVREMKAEYAKCSVGDGYMYDLNADHLEKLKFIKVV